MKKLSLLVALVILSCVSYGQGQIVINTTRPTTNAPAVVEPVKTTTATTTPAEVSIDNTANVVEPAPKVPTPATEPTMVTIDYNRLTPVDRAKFNEYAREAKYGSLIKKNLTGCTITSITTVKEVPSRSGKKMTQYVVIYLDQDGEKQGLLMIDNPIKGCQPCYIKCMVNDPGYHQGDDVSLPVIQGEGESHNIPEW